MSFSATTRFPAFRTPADSGNPAEEAAPVEASSIEVSDEVLMEGLCAGEKEALAQLFRRYARVVRTVAFRILRDGAEADDLLQELFLFINRKCAKFDGSKGSARSWIVQMTYHLAIDRRRYLSSRHFYTQVNIDGPAMEVHDPRGDVLPYDWGTSETTITGVSKRCGSKCFQRNCGRIEQYGKT